MGYGFDVPWVLSFQSAALPTNVHTEYSGNLRLGGPTWPSSSRTALPTSNERRGFGSRFSVFGLVSLYVPFKEGMCWAGFGRRYISDALGKLKRQSVLYVSGGSVLAACWWEWYRSCQGRSFTGGMTFLRQVTNSHLEAATIWWSSTQALPRR